MGKTFKSIKIVRHGSNRPADVHALTESGMKYIFSVAPELSDRRVIALVGRLIYHEQREYKGGSKHL